MTRWIVTTNQIPSRFFLTRYEFVAGDFCLSWSAPEPMDGFGVGGQPSSCRVAESRITPEIRTQLKKIAVGPKNKNHTLNEFIDEWIQLGKQLGTLEKEKALLAPTQADSPSTGMNLVAARNKWLRTVNLFIAVAVAAELDPKTDHIIFSSLRAAEAKSARRGRSTTPNDDAQTEESTEEPHKP